MALTSGDAQIIKMTQTPVKRLVVSLAVPTIITMLVTSIYNTADTYFVSQINQSASGAVSVVFSLMAIMQAVGFMFGIGSGSNISQALGRHDIKRASELASSGLTCSIIFGILLCILGNIFIKPLVNLLGATPTIRPYAAAYARYILFGAPFICSSFVMNNIMRSQGRAVISMIGIGLGGILNIILDPIFIFTFKLGITGAALATILSQIVSFTILLVMMLSGKSIARLGFKYIARDAGTYFLITKTGFPSFVRQTLASIATILLNNAAGSFNDIYGDAAVAAMGIVTRVMMLMISVMLGFGQGFQPVCGFSYGARLYKRVREAFRFSLIVCTVFLAAVAVIAFIFAPEIVELFRKGDTDVIAIGTKALRIYCVSLPLQSFIICSNMLLQQVGRAWSATFIALARQGLFFIPLILILPKAVGLLGVQIAQPISDLLCFLTCFIFTPMFFRSIPREDTPIESGGSIEDLPEPDEM